MASVTSTGIGSGLDIESIITKLMAVEKQPLTALQTKEASYQSKLTAFGTLKSSLSTFQSAISTLSNASAFQGTTASIANTAVATVTSSTSATAGSYSLTVSKLAQAQQLVATGQSSNTASIGTGTITIDFGTITGGTLGSSTGQYSGATFTSAGNGVKTITIDSSNNTLTGIRDAINNAAIGVTATIVNDGGTSPYRLVLASDNSGSANSMKISVSGDSALSSLLSNDPAGTQNMSETTTAQNAAMTVNGISISKASNTVTDAINGVTLNLLTQTTSATTITVARDTTSVTSAVNAFVSAYNTLNSTIKQATAYDATTKTAAILNGESSVRNIQTQLRAVLNTPIAGGASAYTLLSQVGVTFQKDGSLSVDSTQLASALKTNFSDFAGLFASAGKTSDSLISFANSTSNSKAGSYAVNVTQLATQGNFVGTTAAGTTISDSNNTLSVSLNGNTATITLSNGTYTAATLAAEIQSKINGISTFSSASSTVKVTQTGGVLTLTSDLYGAASKVSITGGTAQDYLGLGSSATATTGVDVAGTINGIAARGFGQSLTGATGDASEGIKINITGGSTGARGTVNYSQGYAGNLTKLVDALLDSDGPITSRTDGLSATIKRLENDQTRLTDRLTTIEKRYRTQFTALDTLMASMSTTSTYLTQQITALQNLNKQSSS